VPFSKRSNCSSYGENLAVEACAPAYDHNANRISHQANIKRHYAALEGPFQGRMGLGPSLYIAGDNLTCHGKAYLCYPAHPESSDSMRSFQFGVRCFNPCTDLVPVLPFSCLLEGIHLIPEANLRGDLQTKVPDGVTGVAAFLTMVGSSHRTVAKLRTGPA
jgi:hypothetical protein